MSEPANPRIKEWRTVCRAMGLLTAQTIQGRLETAGIPAVLDYDGTRSLLGIPSFGGTGEVRILVPLDRIAEAHELLGADSELDEDIDQSGEPWDQ